MSTTTSAPYDWIGELDPKLAELDEIPLLGNPPPFPLESLGQKFSDLFEIEGITLSSEDPKWRSVEELFFDMGDNLLPLTITLPEFDGKLFWLIAKEDIQLLMATILTKKESPPIQEIGQELQEGFYHFLAMETIHLISELEYDQALSPHISESRELPQEPCLCIDIQTKLFKHSIWGRLAITPNFRRSWKEHCLERKLPVRNSDLAEQVRVTIQIEAGRVQLPYHEWTQISKGDFILLDKCGYDPLEKKGRVNLTLNDKPILSAKFKRGKLKIVGLAQHYEEDTPMDNNNIEEEFAEEENLEISEEEELEVAEGEDEEYEIIEEEIEVEVEVDEDEEEEFEETVVEEEESEIVAESFEGPPIAPNEIPLNLVVEIGRLQISMQKLMEMQPGNILELGIKPESGVSLMIHGKCVGKGELLKVGKTLGIRVLDIGKS